jgi:Txe/YoeB family toxin of Txe-Axe toxin-antitoxin module
MRDIDKDRIKTIAGQQDEMSDLKLRSAREELRIKQLTRQEKEGSMYPVKRFLHLKELYFTNAPKRVNQEHRNWMRIVAKKFEISEADKAKLDKEFSELINKTYQDELDALESAMKMYDEQRTS